MGIPVVCNDIGDTGFVIRSTGTGLLVDEYTPDAFNTAIRQLPQITALDKRAIRTAAIDLFDLQKGTALYQKVYHQVINDL